MKRVLVLGQAGAGKSHFAVALGAITGLPVFHMDRVHWRPGGQERDREERNRLVHEIMSGDEWILEGGLSATSPEPMARADTAIWLDLPLGARIRRILGRRWRLRGARIRPGVADICPERPNPGFLCFLWRTRRSARERIAAALAAAPHLTVHRIRTRAGADTFLEWLRDDVQDHG